MKSYPAVIRTESMRYLCGFQAAEHLVHAHSKRQELMSLSEGFWRVDLSWLTQEDREGEPPTGRPVAALPELPPHLRGEAAPPGRTAAGKRGDSDGSGGGPEGASAAGEGAAGRRERRPRRRRAERGEEEAQGTTVAAADEVGLAGVPPRRAYSTSIGDGRSRRGITQEGGRGSTDDEG